MNRLDVPSMLRAGVACVFLAAAPAALLGQTPPEGGPSAGRVLWLRGDRGVVRGLSDLVSEWRDDDAQNGLACTDGATQPEWRAAGVNGCPALHFDGNDRLDGWGAPVGSYTKVAVCQLDELASFNDVLGSRAWRELYFAGTDRARLARGGAFVASGAAVHTGVPIVLVATYDTRTGAGALWQDGQQVGAGNVGQPRNDDDSLLLGTGVFKSFLHGSIAEVLVYDRVLTATDLAQLHAYLLHRYHDDPAPAVQWSALPRPGQVLQRALDGTADALLAGSIASTQWNGLVLQVARDGVLVDAVSQKLVFAGGSAPFSFTRKLLSGRHDYELALYAVRGSAQRLVARIGNLAVGDVWLINGQSNAVAADFHGEQMANAESQSHWVRSFGSATYLPDLDLDQHWDVAEGQGMYAHASVGAWGLRAAFLLQERYDVPIGLINGAMGSSWITLHQRDDLDHEDVCTIYGRLLRRANAAGVRDAVRGMFWYQGEGEYDPSFDWRAAWDTLRQAWVEDYPSLRRIYLFQIRDDCEGHGNAVREDQRELPDTEPDTYAMSTTAAPQHDGCHFHYAGYRELGERLARVLGRDFYGSLDTQEIDPPNVASAVWNDAAHTEILLTFRDLDDRLVLDPGAAASFVTDDTVGIHSASVDGNTVLLSLTGPSAATRISYAGHPYDGPWLKNMRNVGALTFFDVPIQ